jgi:hypothetical protein
MRVKLPVASSDSNFERSRSPSVFFFFFSIHYILVNFCFPKSRNLFFFLNFWSDDSLFRDLYLAFFDDLAGLLQLR